MAQRVEAELPYPMMIYLIISALISCTVCASERDVSYKKLRMHKQGYEKVVLGEQLSFMRMLLMQHARLPQKVVDFILDYEGQFATKFISYISTMDNSYQRTKDEGLWYTDFVTFGIGGTISPQVPLVLGCCFERKPPRENEIPPWWNAQQLSEDLVASFPGVSPVCTPYARGISCHYVPHDDAPLMSWRTVQGLAVLNGCSTVSLVEEGSAAAEEGRQISLICMIPAMSFRNLAQLWKNSVIYLSKVRSQLPGKRFNETGCTVGIERSLDALIDNYSKHEKWIEALINDRDGSLIPIFCRDGTLEECICSAQKRRESGYRRIFLNHERLDP